MNLIIDIGNTRTKVAVCHRGEVLITIPFDRFDVSYIEVLKREYDDLNMAILSSVTDYSSELRAALEAEFDVFLELDHKTPLPVENCYETRETLGKDRIAAVVGAFDMYPNKDILVVDAGTAITYDLLTADGKYRGGNIAPGLAMRFRALHQFTGKLPQLEPAYTNVLYGTSTEQAIRAGVQNGLVYEVDATISAFKASYPDIKVIITGGDAEFFDKKLKNSFFVHFNLTSLGLNRILEHNGEQ